MQSDNGTRTQGITESVSEIEIRINKMGMIEERRKRNRIQDGRILRLTLHFENSS